MYLCFHRIGNPVGGGSLLTRQWGYDIVSMIKNITDMDTYVFYIDSAVLGEMMTLVIMML